MKIEYDEMQVDRYLSPQDRNLRRMCEATLLRLEQQSKERRRSHAERQHEQWVDAQDKALTDAIASDPEHFGWMQMDINELVKGLKAGDITGPLYVPSFLDGAFEISLREQIANG